MSDDLENVRIQLAIREMQSTITSNIETKLFRYYRNLGSVVLTLLAAVGITVGWPTIQSLIDERINGQIDDKVKDKVDPVISEARAAAEKARGSAESASGALDTLRASIARSDTKAEAIETRQYKNNEGLSTMEARITELNRTIDLQKQGFQPLTTVTNQVTELAAQLKDLSDKTASLSRQVETLAGENVPERESAAKINSALSAIAKSQQQNLTALQQEQSDPRNNRIVYVQFAGGQRSDIETITDALSRLGWKVPGEERISTAKKKNEVRYFYADDSAAATQLADDTNGIRGPSADAVKPIFSTPDKPPKSGTLELWLDVGA